MDVVLVHGALRERKEAARFGEERSGTIMCGEVKW
jgi:hypothetical protein